MFPRAGGYGRTGARADSCGRRAVGARLKQTGAPKDWFGMPENVVRAVHGVYLTAPELGARGADAIGGRRATRNWQALRAGGGGRLAPRRSRCCRRRRSRLAPSHSSPRSTRCCGIRPSWRACSTSTMSGRASSRRRNAGGAITCSRSSSATVSWAGSNRGSTGTEPAWKYSASGGRRASLHAVPTGSSTPCAKPSARTCASRAWTLDLEWAAHLGGEERLFPARL